jgi:hypothetical protein
MGEPQWRTQWKAKIRSYPKYPPFGLNPHLRLWEGECIQAAKST